MLAHILGWLKPRPKKPPCQSCNSFIFCAINDVRQCPKLKRPSWFRRTLFCSRDQE